MGYISAPPRPNPDKSPGCYADGRDCSDVENEAIDLLEAIVAGRPKIFQAAWWRLLFLKHKYFPLDPFYERERRRQYLVQQYERGNLSSFYGLDS